MANYMFSICTTGQYEYLMDTYQQFVCDNGGIEEIANELFDGMNCGELEDIDMTGYSRDDEYITIYVEGYFSIGVSGVNEESAYKEALELWEEADFGILDDLEINE